uniref:Uncharacterized protein n=1 Tax=Octopus bimaculoides TaxID=37653 RepID=A0A0L8FRF6_OCTBM
MRKEFLLTIRENLRTISVFLGVIVFANCSVFNQYMPTGQEEVLVLFPFLRIAKGISN